MSLDAQDLRHPVRSSAFRDACQRVIDCGKSLLDPSQRRQTFRHGAGKNRREGMVALGAQFAETLAEQSGAALRIAMLDRQSTRQTQAYSLKWPQRMLCGVRGQPLDDCFRRRPVSVPDEHRRGPDQCNAEGDRMLELVSLVERLTCDLHGL